MIPNHVVAVIIAAIVFLTPVLVWIGFLVWAAIGDGRKERRGKKPDDRWR